MREHWLIHLIWTAVTSPILVIAGVFLRDSKLAWLGELFFTPGVALTSLLGGMNGHIPNLGLMLLSELVCNWAILLICVTMIEFIINRRREI